MQSIQFCGFSTMLDFDAVQRALEGLAANTDAAEAHGTLCALLLGNASLEIWLAHTLDAAPDAGDVVAAERLAVLAALYRETRDQLLGEEFEFAPLLPDDNDEFGQRLLALSSWCQGFVYGFGAVGVHDPETLDDAARECLSDLLEISKLGHDEETSDEAEQQYLEIVEHVRMATLLLHETLNPLEPSETVH